MADTPAYTNDVALIATFDPVNQMDAVVPPIAQTSLFTFSSFAEMEETYKGLKVRPVYSRGLNPTVRLFEEKLAAMEGGEDALGCASGMAAISTTLLAFLSPGDRVLAVRHIYPDTYRLLEILLRRMEIDIVYVDGRDIRSVREALPATKLFYMESPTSWVMEAHDIGTLSALAKAEGVLTVMDNSWATPVFQRPLSLGVDLVVHSASKYLGGHSDVVAGAVVGSNTLISNIRTRTHPYLGGKLSPFDAWLLIRGLRTLALRMKAHEESALAIARFLRAHTSVEEVHHPALTGQLPRGLCGTSGLFSAVFKPHVDIRAFVDNLRIFKLGVSWGGHESLCVPAQIVLAQNQGPNSAHAFGIHPQSVRLHVGLEGTDALIGDLERAISTAIR